MSLSVAILLFVTAQRLGELVLAARNTKRLLALGGVESGEEHYPLIVGLHAAWLGGLWWLAWDEPANLAWLGAYAVLQGFRLWILLTLGSRWTTRIITLPGEPPVRRGPYRFLRHPNYVVVAAEVIVLPLVFGLAAFGAVFFLLNASVLWVRIHAEEAAWRSAGRMQGG
jgi:methyltransferase